MVAQTLRKFIQSACALGLLFFLLTVSAQTTDNYQPGPDSKPQPGVPKGEVLKFTFDNSRIFPGTKREYWLFKYSNGITLSPDQSLLYVSDYRSHWVYSYVIQPDGTLQNKQRFYWLHVPDTSDQSNADGLRVDREGRLYVATAMGIQVCDQAGKVQCIISTPNRRLSNFAFGGAQFDTLFATCGDKVYKRKLKVTGANAWDKPNKSAPPRL